MRNWLKQSLRNQLIFYILIAVIAPVFFLGIVSYISAVNVSEERANISGISSIGQLETSLNFIVEDVTSLSVFLIGNRDVQDYMDKNTSTPRQRSNINGFLANLAYSKEHIANITLYPLSENPMLSTNMLASEEHNFTERSDNKWWTYNNYEKTNKGYQETITFVRPVRSLNDFQTIGYLSISLNQKYLTNLLQSVDMEWSSAVLLVGDGQVLASNQKEDMSSLNVDMLINNEWEKPVIESSTEVLDGRKSTVFQVSIDDVDWKLFGVIPYDEYSSQNKYLLFLTIFTMVIASLFVFLVVLFFVLKILDPLLTLTKSLKNTEPGEKIEQYDIVPENEIGQLMSSYNDLNERISFLMERVKAGESLKRQVDLQALQNQINPHFLYNTLASIHWIALGSGSKEISETVSSLSTYLRYSLNKGDEYCTVEQEIEHLSHYVNIQKMRFPNMFTLTLHVREEVKGASMLKLLLQPLIENSIMHGKLPGMGGLIDIVVTIEQQKGRLHFTIEDDGVGMSEETKVRLQNQFLEDEHGEVVVGQNYGLRNVNLRLMLHYGAASRLQLASEEGKGVTITFSIPVEAEDW